MESKHRAALTRVQHFLAAAFSADELRRFVWEVGGQDLVTGLSELASLSALAFEVTTALDRRGALNRAFFRALIDARPGRAAEIHDLAALFDVALAGARSIVLLYAVDGASAASELARHLRAHQRGGLVDVHMVQVSAMEEGEDPRFYRAVCAILVTPRIVDEIDSSTVKWLLHRNIVGDLRLQPVIVASIPWMKSPLGRLLGRSPSLPSDGRAIEEWMESEAGWDDVALGLLRALWRPNRPLGLVGTGRGGEARASAAPAPKTLPLFAEPLEVDRSAAPAPLLTIKKINQIFRTTGVPDVNFVAPAQLEELVDRMGFMGEGLVIEGPSGIGKTTAAQRALVLNAGAVDFKGLEAGAVRWLKAKDQDDVAALERLLDGGYAALRGHLVIDDFHHLDPGLQRRVADWIKLIADSGGDQAKIVVIGINPVGSSLVQGFPDLAGRFAVVSMRRQPDEKIEELIRKGEEAANISFERRPDFVAEARGSFYTAQMLCLEAARRERITETATSPQRVRSGPDGVVLDHVHSGLKFKYQEELLAFASYDESPPPRGACLTLLWLLAQEPDNAVSLATARSRLPHLAGPIDWLLASNLAALFERRPRLRALLFYNRAAGVLSAEDPQLDFYLQHLSWSALARDAGCDLAFEPERGFLPRERARPAPAALRGAQPRSRVLHLSDLHFGTEPQALLWYDQLAADLREIGCDSLDAVVVSGDLSERAASEEFTAAASFLRYLKDDFLLAPSQFIVVPGNHDLSWPIAQKAYKVHRRAEYSSPLEDGAFIDKGEFIEVPDEAALRERFQPFADFYFQVRAEQYPLDYEGQATVHHFAERRLIFLGLNSAWRIDHAFRDRADIYGVALGRALRRIREEPSFEDCLKIAVWHHPVASPGDDRLRDTGFVERLAQAGFRLALHGHVHKAQPGLFRYDLSERGRRIDFLGAGTFGAPTREWVPGIPLQYQVLEIEGGKARVVTRRREELEGAWRPDARWTRGPGQDPSPYYEIEL